MFEFFSDVVVGILDFFTQIYHADERPEAQRFTIGCGLIVFIAIGLFVLGMVWR